MSDKYVFFWEWEESPTNPLSLAVLSQWYASAPFLDPNHPNAEFKTAEHYMMYAKALLFDPPAAQAILDAPTAAEAKKLGRNVANFNRKVWNEKADDIVERANYLKFQQHSKLLGYLIDTEGKILVEASETDRIWGIGFSAKDALDHVDEWGTNRMGLALTRARDQLIEEGRAGERGSS